ncbi:TauD/TfdA family dioxygenase [Bradyrhizobium sp. WSM1253]|uniref:TauD/TfdA family dioxygenase n=1 Tax=Bradyrhizobium sp. WSM1253 TaxID=319003 RepID=UPI00025D169B|nr:putative taurine catabolism dioxygenase [Bradyrhizobium sp. WSM1253]
MRETVDRELLQRVRRDGWHLLPLPRTTESFSEDLLRFSRRLGDPVPGRMRANVEVLRPLAPEAARPRSLSALHGSNTFPLHTDGAYRLLPPQFILLACQCPGTRSVPTVLVHFADIQITNREKSGYEGAPFLVSNGRRSFYTTIVQPGRGFIRFDMGCMTPASVEAVHVQAAIQSQLDCCMMATIHWREGDVLIIDNWSVLHGRGEAAIAASPDRCLVRVSVQ